MTRARFFAAVAAAVLCASGVVAQPSTENAANEYFLRACRLVLKPEARRAEFAATVRYIVDTDSKGSVSAVMEDPATKAPPPFRPEIGPIEECLRSWHLRPTGKYTVELRWGSAGDETSWRACPRDGRCIQVVVPRSTP